MNDKKSTYIIAVHSDADNHPYINFEGSTIDVCSLLATLVKVVTEEYRIPLNAFCDIVQGYSEE